MGQDEAKVALCVAVYNHYKRIQHMQAAAEADVELQKSQHSAARPHGQRKDAACPDAGAAF